MAHVVNSDGEEVQQRVCLLEPDRDFMDRTGVLEARVLVDTTTCSVPVQLAVMRETTLQKGTRLGMLCSVPAPETVRETVRVAATGYEYKSNEREESEKFL